MKLSEDQTSVEALSTISRLHKEGSLTDNEFYSLKQKIVAVPVSPQVADHAAATNANNASSTFGLIVIALIGLIVLDHVNGAILPDEVYCVVGAGSSIVEPGRTEANSWSANNGCGAYRPECATSWVSHPPGNRCVHGTLWDAIQSKLKNP